jgi:MATE family multidrug resistance protein
MKKGLGKHLKETMILAVPLVIGQLGQMMMGVVDSVMVGHLGAAPLAAASLGSGLFLIILLFGTGITLAVSPLVSQAFGEGNFEKCGQVLRQAILLTLVVGSLLTVVAVYGARAIHYMGQKPDVEVLAIAYAKTLGWSVIPFMWFMTHKQFAEGVNHMMPGMVVSIAANLFNAFGNYLFIYGKFGCPAMGLEGAGWATFTTRLIMGLGLMVYILFSKKFRLYSPGFHFKSIRWDLIGHLLKVGVPSGVQYLFEVSAFVASAFMIGWLGKNELAAHQIAMNLASITYMLSLGVSMASTVRVARFFGQKDYSEVREAGRAAFMLILSIMVGTGLFFALANHLLPAMYIDHPEVIRIASGLILLAALFQLSDGLQAVCLGALRGIQDVSVPARITFLAYWVVGIPFGWFLAFKLSFGVTGIWLGLVVGLTISASLLTWRFFKTVRGFRIG